MKTPKNSKLCEYQKKYNHVDGICEKCGRNLPLTVDHIIPAYLLEQMGLYDEMINDVNNFSLLCRYCNAYKGGRLDMLNPKTISLLQGYCQKLK